MTDFPSDFQPDNFVCDLCGERYETEYETPIELLGGELICSDCFEEQCCVICDDCHAKFLNDDLVVSSTTGFLCPNCGSRVE